MKKILAFETSCDDTAVAIVDETGRILAESMFSQLLEHAPYLGVVPEIGSRAHIEQILHVTKAVFHEANLSADDINVVAVTCAPGLLGPLLVGAQFAKGFAFGKNIPFIGIHHIEGHIFSGFTETDFPMPPFLALIASGGHSSIYHCSEDYSVRVIGQTLDDAAGEAFDKIGRALGLGYPAGKIMDDLAKRGDATRFPFPIALKNRDGFDFSFSGLKTRALDTLKRHAPLENNSLQDFCAGVQEAIAKALCERVIKAARAHGISSVVIGGGVAANSRVRSLLADLCTQNALSLYLPKVRYCTDNAVMIARAALVKMRAGLASDLFVDVKASLPVERAHELTNAASKWSAKQKIV